ncbi:hypothetical protein Glo7428_2332 [Gloeocapsa sp. PCC 7428]|uniref:hypothetical protein n=1 Tax=Gloeocapsa sp. PCC 7428 TaxID=1173026 RepID=UPI0002A604F7|nr:hypothetical protein [Gloeocapsa sp. PCC 7428]AFZ30844.1 hypothetical protein Glo7428_2332 [Gloeocapsa sp. PCC 7428]
MAQPNQPRYYNQSEIYHDTTFKQQVEKLHQLTVYGRWLFVGILWLTIGLLSLWGLREEIALWRQYFTWVAVRYGLYYNPIPTLGLAICIGMTLSVLIWQSRNILWGIPSQEKRRLEQQVHRIRQQGATHPLWKWVCR